MSSDAPATEVGHTYVLDIAMSCGGCSGAISRKLSKEEGVISYDVSLETQQAVVKTLGTVKPDAILSSLLKTGKTIKGFSMDGVSLPLEEMKAQVAAA